MLAYTKTNTHSKIVLHLYQSVAVDAAVEILVKKDQPSVLIQSATGSGKTVIAGALVKLLSQMQMGTKFIIVVPSMTLVEQFYATLVDDYGLPVMVLHNELKKDKNGRIFNKTQVFNIILTMPETFAGIVAGTSNLKLPKGWEANFVVMDEAHKNTAASSQSVRDRFSRCKVIGLTATPRREQNINEGEHLWDWYGDRLIIAASTAELIKGGFICAPLVTRFEGNTAIVNDWLEYTKGFTNKRTIVVCGNTDEAAKLTEQFQKKQREGSADHVGIRSVQG